MKRAIRCARGQFMELAAAKRCVTSHRSERLLFMSAFGTRSSHLQHSMMMALIFGLLLLVAHANGSPTPQRQQSEEEGSADPSSNTAIPPPTGIEKMNPILRYRLRLQFQERLRQLGQTLSGRRRNPAPVGTSTASAAASSSSSSDASSSYLAPTHLIPSQPTGLAGRNCFFSPIQCQLPILEINRQANAAASAIPLNFSPSSYSRREADFRLKRRRLTDSLEIGVEQFKVFGW